VFFRPANAFEAVIIPLIAGGIFVLFFLLAFCIAHGIEYLVTGSVVGYENVAVIPNL
jgi:hypothetical protein